MNSCNDIAACSIGHDARARFSNARIKNADCWTSFNPMWWYLFEKNIMFCDAKPTHEMRITDRIRWCSTLKRTDNFRSSFYRLIYSVSRGLDSTSHWSQGTTILSFEAMSSIAGKITSSSCCRVFSYDLRLLSSSALFACNLYIWSGFRRKNSIYAKCLCASETPYMHLKLIHFVLPALDSHAWG